MAMFQKIIFISTEAATEYTLFKGSLSCSKWICQSLRRQFLCISCSPYISPLKESEILEDLRKLRFWSRKRHQDGYERWGVKLLLPGRANPGCSWKRSKMHPQGFCSCWVLHNYKNNSQLWRTDTHPLLQGIILTKSGSKYPYSQPFNLQRWGVCSVNLTCRYYKWI